MNRLKEIFVLLFFTLNCVVVQATVCADKFFLEQHVNLAICKNHGRGLEKASLYYKGVTKALSDYIGLRIKRGELQDKKFEIYMLDPILTRPHFSLTQSSKGYYIQTGRALSLDELISLVDEFTQPGFTAIDMGLWEYKDEQDYDRQTRRLERLEERLFNKDLSQDDIGIIKNTEYIISQQNGLKITYINDKVRCFIQGNEIEAELTGLPFVINDRYILQESGVFKVYEGSVLIKTFRYSDDEWDSEHMEAEVYNKWVNFGNPQYSYSYDKNRFYYTGTKKD